MFFNFFKKRRLRREREALGDKLKTINDTFRILDRMEETHLLSFDRGRRRLFIEENLAVVMLATERSWQQFINGCYLWLTARETSDAWKQFLIEEENKAVKRAKKRSSTVLSANDIKRIREARRKDIVYSDMQPPELKPIEFFVIRNNSEAVRQTKDGATDDTKVNGGEILLVGTYNGIYKELDMERWETVQKFMGKLLT